MTRNRVLQRVMMVLLVTAFTAPATEVRAAFLPASVSPPLLCRGCTNFGGGEGSEHIIDAGAGTFFCEGISCHYTEWEFGTCQAWHCGGCDCIGGGDIEVVESAPIRDGVTRAAAATARRGDADAIVALLRAHGDRVRYNTSREVVQVHGCAGKVVAQFALSASIVESLD